MHIVGDLEQMVSEDLTLDHRVHARIIGGRGKAVRKIMDEFKVHVVTRSFNHISGLLFPYALLGYKVLVEEHSPGGFFVY